MMGSKKIRDFFATKSVAFGPYYKHRGTNNEMADDKALKASGRNHVEIALIILEDRHNNRLVRIIVTIPESIEAWHRHQNVELRDVQRTKQWLLQQFRGDLGRHLAEPFLLYVLGQSVGG